MELILFIALLFGVIILANLAEARKDKGLRQLMNWLLILGNVPVLVMGSMLLWKGSQEPMPQVLNLTAFAPARSGVIFIILASWGLLITLPTIRQFIARFLPIDPHSTIHSLALLLVGYLVGNSFLTLSQGGLEGLAENAAPTSIIEIVATGLFFVSIAVIGVGLVIRRDRAAVLERLGLCWPTGREIIGGLHWTILLIALQGCLGGIWFLLNPHEVQTQEEVSGLLMGNIDTIWEWLILALATGISEEILFRGALQPILGLWPTALVFALAHFQYGFNAATAIIFLIGLVLGQIRRRQNTTTSILIHVSYNFTLGLLSLLVAIIQL